VKPRPAIVFRTPTGGAKCQGAKRMDDVVKDFLVESYENLDRMDRDFVELEKNPSKEILQNIFRPFTLSKALADFLALASSNPSPMWARVY
jgi:chemotaxis protein histidine kinase CheA